MPTIGFVDGVRIAIHLKDHLPPHLHAFFGDDEAQISIMTGQILNGRLSPAKARAVVAWLAAHREEVAYIWREIRHGRHSGGLIE